ncbi:hypothetical protein DFP73DRAFT_524724 [Morchella snyderi]|nr:hypothetical protein DFP73DRAFT_524724 [Morchella snyderi]
MAAPSPIPMPFLKENLEYLTTPQLMQAASAICLRRIVNWRGQERRKGLQTKEVEGKGYDTFSNETCPAISHSYTNFDWLTAPQLDDIVLSLSALLDDLLSQQPAQGHSEVSEARCRKWNLENPHVLEEIALAGTIRSAARWWQKQRHDLAKADKHKAREEEWSRFKAQGDKKLVVMGIVLEGGLKVIFHQEEQYGLVAWRTWEGGSSVKDTLAGMGVWSCAIQFAEIS